MNHGLNALTLLVAGGLFAHPVAAQTEPVDDLDLIKVLNVQVSTATKTAESLDEAPAVWLYQYQGLQGVSNRFDFKANPGEDVYGWDLKPRR